MCVRERERGREGGGEGDKERWREGEREGGRERERDGTCEEHVRVRVESVRVPVSVHGVVKLDHFIAGNVKVADVDAPVRKRFGPVAKSFGLVGEESAL